MRITEPRFLRSVSVDSLVKRRRTPTLISLFSGCGGFALGARQAGFEVRVFVENDSAAVETLRVNWIKSASKGRRPWHQRRDPVILERDMTLVSVEEILEAAGLEVGEADCLEGGFPCQGFSTSGKRMIDDPRNRLYKECVRVIRGTLPRTFMLENVPGLVSMKRGEIVRQICLDLSRCGYDLRWDILNAADYGVPQNRRRVFFIGQRVDVTVLGANGRLALYMGAASGAVYHPEWFEKKYNKGARR